MRISVGQLRKIFKEGLDEAKIAASPDYMKKEKVREELQNLIAARVAAGEIQDQAQLEQFIKDVSVSMTSLKMIPLDVWKKLASSK